MACPEMLETDGRQAEADLFNLEDPFWISIVDQCHFRCAPSTHMPIISLICTCRTCTLGWHNFSA